MKPRLLPLRWTVEDFDLVWLEHLAKRKPFEWHTTHLSYIEADRRDADLMYDNVLHQVSAVVRVDSGEWGYWIHNSVLYRETVQCLNAPLTQEDFDIWDRLSEPHGKYQVGVPLWGYTICDRRDADLMWKLSTYTTPGHLPVIHLLLRVDENFHLPDLLPFAESSFIEIARPQGNIM